MFSHYFFLFFLFLSCTTSDKENISEIQNNKIHEEAFDYCKTNNFNTDFYYLIDLSIHSGKNRFFVYNFNEEKVTHKNLVTHGSCDVFEANPNQYDKVKFSNQNNSHCSSKGKYKIGSRDYSSWGINVKYWIHGLESTNNNAVKRVVVLHSWSAVSNSEIYPSHSPLSWGCPAVSDEFMHILDEQLKNVSQPVLLWIVD
jgi:hypothetical protein